MSARQALRAAVDLQAAFEAAAQSDGVPLRVGIGIDAGEAVAVEGGFRGAALNLAARLCSLAGPGEVLASEGVVHLARRTEGLRFVDRGRADLKGFTEPVRVIEVMPLEAAVGGAEEESGGWVERVGPVSSRGASESAPPLPIGGFLGALPSSELVARDADLAEVLGCVDEVQQGRGRFAVLPGEPGVGKTRLAQEVMLTVRNRGFLVGAGSCYEPQAAVPFYPFLEALDPMVRSGPPQLVTDLPRRWPAVLALLPGRSGKDLTASFSSREDQQRLYWELTGFLEALAEQSPVALLFDDLHWADEASLDLLQHLARHTRGSRVFLLGTYRDVDVGRHHPLERMLLELNRQQLLERIPVRRLRQEGTADLVKSAIGDVDVSPEFAALLYRHTDGNPFFVREVARALVERGDVYQENGHWRRRALEAIEVPESVRAVIGQRLSHLAPVTQEIAHEASILGQTFSFDDLQDIGDRDEEELETALEEMAAAGLIRDAGRDLHSFNHALTQQALHTEVPSRRRRRLHRAAGEVLERRLKSKEANLAIAGEAAAKLEWHFLHADDPERAFPYALLVGDASEAVFAHDDAAKHLYTALELAEELQDSVKEAQVCERLGGLLTATIRYAEALVMLERAARLYRTVGDTEQEALVVAQIGRVHVAGGDLERGARLVEKTLDSLADRGSTQAQAALLSVLGRLQFVLERFGEALNRADQAASLARSVDIGGVAAEAEVTRGAALVMLGEWLQGRAVLDGAVQYAEEVGDLFSACRGLQHLAGVFVARGELEVARETMARALGLADRMDNRRQISVTTHGLALIAFLTGDRERAVALSDRALAVMRELGGYWRSPLSSAGLSLLSLGEWEAMPDALRDCVQFTEASSRLPGLREERFEAERELLAGYVDAALARLTSLTARDLGQQALGVTPLLASAYLETGNADRAASILDVSLSRARANEQWVAAADLLRVRGRVLLAHNDVPGAEGALEEARTLTKRMPNPYIEARILLEIASLRRRKGEPHEELTRQAETMLEGMGAGLDSRRTVSALLS